MRSREKNANTLRKEKRRSLFSPRHRGGRMQEQERTMGHFDSPVMGSSSIIPTARKRGKGRKFKGEKKHLNTTKGFSRANQEKKGGSYSKGTPPRKTPLPKEKQNPPPRPPLLLEKGEKKEEGGGPRNLNRKEKNARSNPKSCSRWEKRWM